MISLIAAIGKNNELGFENKLIWSLPEDMKRFREITMNHKVVMGKRTFESIGRPLPSRENIVATRDMNFMPENVKIILDFEKFCKFWQDDVEEVFVIGGAQIYDVAIKYAKKLYITHIDEAAEADAFFPDIDSKWRKSLSEDSKDNSLKCSFTIYRK